MKTVYSIDSATLGQAKEVKDTYQVNRIFETEQAPIKNATILAWDSKTATWYDAGGKTEQAIAEVTDATIELYEMVMDLQAQIEELKGGK